MFSKNNIKVNTDKPIFDLLKQAKNTVESGRCPSCLQPVLIFDFKDHLSIKEYTISGLCQHCQDTIFNTPLCED